MGALIRLPIVGAMGLRRDKNAQIRSQRSEMEQVKVDLRERTKDFALSVVRIFSALPKTTEAQILGRQVLRFRHLDWCELS